MYLLEHMVSYKHSQKKSLIEKVNLDKKSSKGLFVECWIYFIDSCSQAMKWYVWNIHESKRINSICVWFMFIQKQIKNETFHLITLIFHVDDIIIFSRHDFDVDKCKNQVIFALRKKLLNKFKIIFELNV